MPAACGGRQSELGVRIFSKKGSDFIQKRQPSYAKSGDRVLEAIIKEDMLNK
ncbi:MAG: hypothetical protein WBC21_04040 [Minisyncoccales bacterium]